ncbi:MAG: hypothetical protein LCI00_24900 [Chloroflexi bacterium]|nr:hypothetical protein [Chloroflexota bacterium]MCC6895774.1 hypothetical protein [Anaerolineae bacterium]
MSENIFAQEWVDCLEAHYTHVIRTKDHVTEPSLTIVMHSAGFTDKQLAELRVRATMHMDDVGPDFVPDLHILDEHSHNHAPEAPEPAVFNIPIDLPPMPETASNEAVAVEAEAENLMSEDELVEAEVDAQPEMVEAELDEDEVPAESEPEEPDPDEPQQLSLF